MAALPAAAAAAPGAATTSWVTDGPVHAMATDAAGRTYIGGYFAFVGPRLGGAIALTASGDQPAADFPDVNGQVLAIADDGAGGWFLGGAFTAVGGVARDRLAHIRADHTLDPTWNPGANDTVRTLVRAGAALYAGGDFTSAGGRPGTRVVKLATTGTGAGDPAFSPVSDGNKVLALALSGSGLYVGTANTLFKADAATGVVDATWSPAPDRGVDALAIGPDGLYAGGAFTTIGGQSRNGLAKLSLTGTGAADPAWDPDVSDGTGVQALALAGADLYVGGGFYHVGGQARYGAAKVASSGTGAVSAWDPGVGPVAAIAVTGAGVYLGGELYATAADARYLVRVAPDGAGAADHWTPNPNAAVTALAAAGDDILAGGGFTSAGAQQHARGGLARLLPDGRLDTTFDPPSQPGGGVNALALDGGTLYVAGSLRLDGGPPVGLRRFSTATGALDPAWTPTIVGAEPEALALSGDSVFAGTSLSSDALLKFSTSGSGARDTTWDPDADGRIYALATSGTSLYVAGSFGVLGNGIDGVYRDVVKLSTTGTGALDAAWDPKASPVFAMALAGDDLYLAGSFPPVGTLNRRLAKVSASGTGAADAAWHPVLDGSVTALAVSGGDLYVGGAFTTIDNAAHARIAKLPLGGSGAPDPAFTFSASGEVDAITASPDRLVIGGAFTSTGSLSTQGVALFDFSAPSVDLSVPADGGRYRIGQDVRAAYDCADPGGAQTIASCAGTVPAGAAIDTSTPGAHSFTVDAADTSGNATTKMVSYLVDDTVPTIAFGALPGGATYTIGERATITYSCADAAGAEDIATCVGPVPSGALLDTSKAGAFTFSVTATDRVGNTATARVSYSVWPPNLKPTPKLTLSALKLSPSAFRAEPRGAATGKPTAAARKLKRGTRVQFTLSAAARTTFTVIRPKKGKVKAKTLGTFTVAGTAKINRFILRGRIAGKKLKPGKYQLRAQAKDTRGTKSATVVKSFTIKR